MGRRRICGKAFHRIEPRIPRSGGDGVSGVVIEVEHAGKGPSPISCRAFNPHSVRSRKKDPLPGNAWMNNRRRKWCLIVLIPLGLFLIGIGLLVVAGLRDHLGKTIELYRKGYFPAVIASGGVGKEGFDEAAVMRDYLVSHGVPREKVIVDSAGITTFASAAFTARFARENGLGSVIVISQYFHVPRSRLAQSRFGIPSVFSAHADYFEARDHYSAPRELVGYSHYALRRYTVR
jgi:hypothetical protein